MSMNYYQITSGLDSDSDSEVGWMVTGVTKHDKGGQGHDHEHAGDQGHDHEHAGDHHQKDGTNLHQAVQECLARDTLDDLRREYHKNTVVTAATAGPQEVKNQQVVVLRKKSTKNTYGRRASQRFSKILEGTNWFVLCNHGYLCGFNKIVIFRS